MQLVDERYGSPIRRDDLSIAKTHRSATLVHPLVRHDSGVRAKLSRIRW